MKRSIAPTPAQVPAGPSPAPQVNIDLSSVVDAIRSLAPEEDDDEDEKESPKQFEVEVTERDARGSIKKLIIKEICNDGEG